MTGVGFRGLGVLGLWVLGLREVWGFGVWVWGLGVFVQKGLEFRVWGTVENIVIQGSKQGFNRGSVMQGKNKPKS